MSVCDRRLFLAAGAGLLAGAPAPRHAAVYVYSRPPIRARHQALVQQALVRRAEVHTSAWAIDKNGKPLLALGPLRGGAGQFHRDRLTVVVQKAWPFVVVLEYDADDQPAAYLDWFRRADDSTDATAWALDPGVGYVEHINAELVTAQDGRLAMIALADTPTQTHVGDSQWAVRGRVRWKDGGRAQKGWWLRFDAPLGKRAEQWSIDQTPLVDWRVTEETKERGILATETVLDLDRQLAVFGTSTVFEFPAAPPGLTAGKGRA